MEKVNNEICMAYPEAEKPHRLIVGMERQVFCRMEGRHGLGSRSDLVCSSEMEMVGSVGPTGIFRVFGAR